MPTTETAAAQLRRILQLIPEFADDREHPIAEVAARVGADRETLLRDLLSLAQRFDDPGGFVEGVQVYVGTEYVSVRSDHFLRPMRLTVAELCALELGLAMLHAERPPDEQRVIEHARSRLRQVIARLPEDPIEDGLRHASMGAAVDPEQLAVVRRAVAARRKLRIAYRRADAAADDERTVCPYALVIASGTWYLVAHCERSDGLRFFRLDRIGAVTATSERFSPSDGFALDDVLRGGRAFRSDEPAVVRIRYSPQIARWIAEREGRAVDADGSVTMDHPLADPDWAVRHVLQYGPDSEVIEPKAVRDALRARLGTMLAAVPEPTA